MQAMNEAKSDGFLALSKIFFYPTHPDWQASRKKWENDLPVFFSAQKKKEMTLAQIIGFIHPHFSAQKIWTCIRTMKASEMAKWLYTVRCTSDDELKLKI